MNSAGLLVGSLAAGRPDTVRRQLTVFELAAAALDLGLTRWAWRRTIAWLVAFALATGVANGLLNVCTSELVLGRADADERGRVAAALTGSLSGAQSMSPTPAAACSPRRTRYARSSSWPA